MIDERELSQKVSARTSLGYFENKKNEEEECLRDEIDREMMMISALLDKARDANDVALVEQLRDKQKKLREKRRAI